MSRKNPQSRGGKSHYRKLAQLSAQNRIRRHISCETRLDPKVVSRVPTRKRETDAGYDVYSAERVEIRPGEVAIIRTGLRVNCPPGYFYAVEGRSSMFARNLIVDRGIIDATYTGEVLVHLRNAGKELQIIDVTDRIAQLVFSPIIHVEFQEVEEFTVSPGSRGGDGYGSSGK